MVEMKLGRKVQHDPRSRNFAFSRKLAAFHTVTWNLDAPVLDQGILGACVGFATAQWFNCSKNVGARTSWNNKTKNIPEVVNSGRRYCDNRDGVYFYSKSTEFDDFPSIYPPEDEGSSALGVAKFLKSIGVISRYEWIFDPQALLSALMFGPILVGTNWYEDMFNPGSKGIITPTGRLAGGHEYLLRGYNVEKDLCRIRNNWTKDWGINGDAFIYREDLFYLMQLRGDAMVLVA